MTLRDAHRPVSTFSIVARDPDSGDFGIAVQSKFLAVGTVVPWAVAGVGAVATQAWANVSYGPDGLALLRGGRTAEETLTTLTEADAGRDRRQAGIVDASGRAATFTGDGCSAWAGGVTGDGFCCQGNILAGPDVVDAMAQAYTTTTGRFSDRLVEALAAGQAAGGDIRGQQSAALLVVREQGGYGGATDRYIDLRVDDHPTPIDELRRLVALHRVYFQLEEATYLPLTPELVTEIQRQLASLGYLTGEHHGFDADTQRALERFAGVENLEERIIGDATQIDSVILEFLRLKSPRP